MGDILIFIMVIIGLYILANIISSLIITSTLTENYKIHSSEFYMINSYVFYKLLLYRYNEQQAKVKLKEIIRNKP